MMQASLLVFHQRWINGQACLAKLGINFSPVLNSSLGQARTADLYIISVAL